MRKAKSRKRKKNGLVLSTKQKYSAIGIVVIFFYLIFKLFVASNVNIKSDKYYVYINDNTSVEALIDTLYDQGLVDNKWSLHIMSRIFSFKEPRTGLYEIYKDWSSFSLVYQFENQEIRSSVKVEIPIRKQRKSAVKILCKKLKLDQNEFMRLLDDEYFLSQYDFDKDLVYCMLIAGSFYTYTEISEEEMFDRIYVEYLHFWNDARLQKAKEIGLSPVEVGILASIVYAETKKTDEMPMVAGLYMNRLNNDMRLQSDPTLVYASGGNVKRVLNKHKKINSKYNTYRRKGLPPGPVFVAPPVAIDAVLNYIEHDYLFFCAKDDFSGYHIFTETYEEHKKNASKYQKKLNALKIMK